MTRTIIALFDNFTVLQDLMKELHDAGIPRDSISVMARDEEGLFSSRARMDPEEESGTNWNSSRMEARGSNFPGVKSMTMPGVGRVVTAGPLASALSGAEKSSRAIGGGLLDALIEAGVPDPQARLYLEGLRRGGMLVMVQPDEREAERISDVINRHHPADLEARQKEWLGANNWTGFNGDAEPFAFNDQSQPYKKRSPASRLDYGPGARDFIEGQPVSDYDRGQADMGRYTGADADDWHLYESAYRAHFEERYEGKGKRWEDYRDAYRFGFNLARFTPYMNEPWDLVRGYAIQEWDSRNMGKNWDEYEDAVYAGWEAAHVPH